jgi:hypothetical protein
MESFDVAQTEYLLLDACWAYRRLTGERPALISVFTAYATVTFGREFLVLPQPLSESVARRWREMTKQTFFAEVLPAEYAATLSQTGARNEIHPQLRARAAPEPASATQPPSTRTHASLCTRLPMFATIRANASFTIVDCEQLTNAGADIRITCRSRSVR